MDLHRRFDVVHWKLVHKRHMDRYARVYTQQYICRPACLRARPCQFAYTMQYDGSELRCACAAFYNRFAVQRIFSLCFIYVVIFMFVLFRSFLFAVYQRWCCCCCCWFHHNFICMRVKFIFVFRSFVLRAVAAFSHSFSCSLSMSRLR